MKTRRRIVQILIFLLFVFLFIKTRYEGRDFLEYPVNIFLKLDPLIALGAIISSRTFISGMIYSFLFILAGFVLGRFFCGWFCPMGTSLDIFSFIFFRGKQSSKPWQWKKLNNIKLYILIFILAAAIAGVQFIWLFDPISILVRTFTVSIFPLFDLLTRNFFNFLYEHNLASLSEPVFEIFKKTILPFKPPVYKLSIFILSFFTVILMLELLGRRFWCRVLCPLGGLFELISKKSIVKKSIDKNTCNECNLCHSKCKMGDTECIMCFDCVEVCPKHSIDFDFFGSEKTSDIDLSRRVLLLGSVSTILISPAFKLNSLIREKHPFLIRPPGALPEDKFLSRCTRCGECMRVCISNALHPTFLEAGLDGLWSPVLVPRLGYCEYNCSLCGQVCPTGAIEELPVEKKRLVKIGLAYFDRNRCIPWAKYTDCLVCEEHCPIPDKAIKFKLTEVINTKGQKVMVKQPYIVEKLCIGCGICENKCPIDNSAVIVKRINTAGFFS